MLCLRIVPAVAPLLLVLASFAQAAEPFPSFSGVFPHLAHTNEEGEVGIGAVVPWAGVLWTNTYGPHLPHGSTDKLRSIDSQWQIQVHQESVGGTPANRMIHPESSQLFIGHHAIDRNGKVRSIDPKLAMPGRITANARHLFDPANKIYHVTMENGLYEVDVNTLEVRAIIKDPIDIKKTHLPGYHAKGAYSANRRLVISNNGEPDQTFPSGCLASWDGQNWTIVARNQFTEVTGPGGLRGNSADDDRLWAMGWDKKSLRLLLLEDGLWHKFRLPKASYTHDAAHGWNTEWPRIRDISPGRFLGHMHGLFFEFPQSFSAANYGGIRPLGSYIKMPVDYAMFQGKLVIGKDDASKFDNAFVQQAQSNLWIGDVEELENWGPKAGFGGVWLEESFDAEELSEPFFIGGFDRGTLHLRHRGGYPVRIELSVDSTGHGNWEVYQLYTIPTSGYLAATFSELPPDTEWIRLRTLDAVDGISAYFQLTSDYPHRETDAKFAPLAEIGTEAPAGAALMLPHGLDMKLHAFLDRGRLAEISGDLGVAIREASVLERTTEQSIAIQAEHPAGTPGVDAASAFVDYPDEYGVMRRLRLPKGDAAFDATISKVRHIRELVTERTHMNLHGTFYELPRPRPGHFINFRRIKPIASHNRHIYDFCSWRGLLVFSGVKPDVEHHHQLALGESQALWLGEVDDLWKFGKPCGQGGPWLDTEIAKDEFSDPYLVLGYGEKHLKLSHRAKEPANFSLQVDFLGNGDFVTYKRIEVPPGETLKYQFPQGFEAHWLRFACDTATQVTAQLSYF